MQQLSSSGPLKHLVLVSRVILRSAELWQVWLKVACVQLVCLVLAQHRLGQRSWKGWISQFLSKQGQSSSFFHWKHQKFKFFFVKSSSFFCHVIWSRTYVRDRKSARTLYSSKIPAAELQCDFCCVLSLFNREIMHRLCVNTSSDLIFYSVIIFLQNIQVLFMYEIRIYQHHLLSSGPKGCPRISQSSGPRTYRRNEPVHRVMTVSGRLLLLLSHYWYPSHPAMSLLREDTILSI